MSPWPWGLQSVVFLISRCRSLSSSVSLSVLLTLSYFFGCLTPHTPFASLVSRTLATRTVMSSMRSWILQLWPPLPAHEALLTLALRILSSMQPSSLAHTSACHYRPFPSDFGLKVHRLMHSFPSFIPLSHALTSLYMLHMVTLSTFLFSLGRLLISPSLNVWPRQRNFKAIISTQYNTQDTDVQVFGTTEKHYWQRS